MIKEYNIKNLVKVKIIIKWQVAKDFNIKTLRIN